MYILSLLHLQVCNTLAILAGNHHQRFGAIAGGLSSTSLNTTMHRVVSAIDGQLKDEFLKFPSDTQIERNAQDNLEKYKLPDFGYGVDGCHFIFQEKPRQYFMTNIW